MYKVYENKNEKRPLKKIIEKILHPWTKQKEFFTHGPKRRNQCYR